MNSDRTTGSVVLPLVLLAALALIAAAIWFVGPFVTIGGLAPFEVAATRALFILSFSLPMLILIYVIWRQRRPRTTLKRRRPYWRYALYALVMAILGVAAIVLWDGGSSGFDAGHVLIAFGVLAIAWAATWYYERSGTRRAAIIYAALVAVGAVIAANVLISYRNNLALIEAAQEDIDAYQTVAAEIPRGPVGDTDFLIIRPALQTLRNMPGTGVFGQTRPSLASTWGLNQSGAIGGQTARTYRSALNQMLLPRMLVRLENELQTNLNDPDRLFAALKVYLMLGLQGPMDRDEVFQWMRDDWVRRYGPNDGVAEELLDHLDALTSQPMESIALNGPLVERARNVLANVPRAQRLYRAILNRPEVRELPEFRLTNVAGPEADRVLRRVSGKPIGDGIVGAFTREGFHLAVLPELIRTVAFQKSESWVLGDAVSEQRNDGAEAVLTQNILELYYADYVAEYDALLSDIEIRPMQGMSDTSDALEILSGAQSPITAILEAVATETQLADFEISSDSPLTTAAVSQLGLRSLMRLSVLRRANPETLPDDPGQPVQDRFAVLHDLADAAEGQATALDDVMGQLTDVSDELRRAITVGDATRRDAATAELADLGARMEDPLGRWITQVSNSFAVIVTADARSRINAVWKAPHLPFCKQATAGRYPFDKQSAQDASLIDFERLFGPDGILDRFFHEELAIYVDTSASPWRWNDKGADLGISDAVLAEFERARNIREAFFRGGIQLGVEFSLRSIGMDNQVSRFELEIEQQEFTYAHGPRLWSHYSWPGPISLSRASFSPAQPGVRNSILVEGPWSLSRLLDSTEIQPSGDPTILGLLFKIGGRAARLEMRTDGPNPFRLDALSEFNCPGIL